MSLKMRGLADPGATGDKAKRQRCEAMGHWLQISTWAAGERTDGFVTRDIVDVFGTAESLARLLRARYDRQPLMHQRDGKGRAPECPCLDGRAWPDDFDYVLHDYLDRNPSRAENDVHKAKRLELRDSKLKQLVRVRDVDTCRYCGRLCKHSDRTSDAGLTYDHVDPERAAGAENLVVACRGCNRRKGARTPEQANMVLLITPGASTNVDAIPTSVSTPVATADLGPDPTPDTGPDPGHQPEPDPDQDRSPSNDLRHVVTRSQPSASPGRDGDRDGLAGAVGLPHERFLSSASPPGIGPPDTDRGSRSQSPYLRDRRPFPDHYAGVPPPAPEPRTNLPRKETAPVTDPALDPDPRPTSNW